MALKDHRAALVAEKAEVDHRLLGLVQFIASGAFTIYPAVEKDLLRAQREAMTAYADALERRIARTGVADV